MKIVFVNRFFHPDIAPTARLASDVAFALAEDGREVHAVTSRINYDRPGMPRCKIERAHGVLIHRVWTTAFGRRTIVGRAFDYATFYLSATITLFLLLRPRDVVVAKTDPPLISVFAAFAACLKRAKLVNWQQDVFPELAAETGFSVVIKYVGFVLRFVRDWSLRRAVVNVALGGRMAAKLAGAARIASERVHVVPNWVDGRRIKPTEPTQSVLRARMAPHAPFLVGYSGNMGRAHDFRTLLEACRALQDDPGISFLFIGGGNQRPLVEQTIREHGLSRVFVYDYVEEENLSDALAAPDVHLVSLLPRVEGLVLPSKFYGIAAAGRPTIFVGDPCGEMARLVKTFDIGLCVSSDDAQALVAAIRMLRDSPDRRRAMGARARKVFEDEWDRPIALSRWRAVIAKVAQAEC